jgi:hypothetical protein
MQLTELRVFQSSAILQNFSVICRAASKASGLDKTLRGHLKHENSAVGQLKNDINFQIRCLSKLHVTVKSASRADFSPKVAL